MSGTGRRASSRSTLVGRTSPPDVSTSQREPCDSRPPIVSGRRRPFAPARPDLGRRPRGSRRAGASRRNRCARPVRLRPRHLSCGAQARAALRRRPERELAASLGTPPSAIDFVNDADAFLIGEWWVGAAAGHRRAAGVTLGTGVGSAYLLDGRIVDTGPHVPPEGSLHLVEFRGRPAEETVSRGALLARYGEPGLDVKDVALRARAGDRRARDVFAELAGALGELAAPWLASFGATCFVVGGSISQSWDLLGPGLHDGLSAVPRLQTIAPAAHVEEAALLGAAYRASQAT